MSVAGFTCIESFTFGPLEGTTVRLSDPGFEEVPRESL